jgi:undecaprenyl-diphosphatase
VAVATLAALALLVSTGATRGVDLAVTHALQSVASPALDAVANADTLIGEAWLTAGITVAFAVWLWRNGARLEWAAPLLLFAAVAVELALKLVLTHPGPPHDLSRTLWHPGPSLETPSSFPSGHVLRVSFLAVVATAFARAISVRVALIALVAVTVWARVYIGHHWLSDAIGGLALGIAAGCAALAWIHRRRGYDRS